MTKNTTNGSCGASVSAQTLAGLRSRQADRLRNALRGAALCLALGVGGVSLPAMAEVRILVQSAPPPMRAEEVPVARRGYEWAPGYWRWHKHQHVWTRGHWVHERRGHRYEGARWEQRGERYHFAPGRWQRDPNRSAPDPMRGGQRHGPQQ